MGEMSEWNPQKAGRRTKVFPFKIAEREKKERCVSLNPKNS